MFQFKILLLLFPLRSLLYVSQSGMQAFYSCCKKLAMFSYIRVLGSTKDFSFPLSRLRNEMTKNLV